MEGLLTGNIKVPLKIKIPTTITIINNVINSIIRFNFLPNDIPEDQSKINGVTIKTLITSPTHHGTHVVIYWEGVTRPPKRRLVTPNVALTAAAIGAVIKTRAITSFSPLIELTNPK